VSAGRQEGNRWKARAHHTRPTISVIEPAEKDDAEPNTPFGFSRVLEPEIEHHEPDAWEGEGL
jgi:hypothetical protein